ncbi:transport protein, belonging to the Major Facilitator Superfamily, of which narK is a member [Candidatus Methylomirabilis lanthanidiphila]|uniref:Transport protein, belonging to the Major Facilitator Superfamily, of which narK is a member n=1 Tax=Candidatus Methylomirabilis lanthanidiphila TaxID=2211376 RepID=A0A564ZKZ6_9BACT|nr:MFS transporter [Candidatus Methylomirabilis lanthanidiphila]VUZ85999.1 transport protein, belonging to the Major Facilitator Superfamily, of which narK is a member [Candidatus Methylomirabilis lanthanidiphila]
MNRLGKTQLAILSGPTVQARESAVNDTISSFNFFVASLSNFFFFASLNAFSLLPLYIKTLGGTESQIGWVMGSYSLTAILGQPLAGALADRFGRKRFLLLGSASGMLAAIGFAYSTQLDARFVLFRILQGIAYSSFYIANLTLVSEMVPSSRRGEAVGLFGISGLITIALSPAIGEQVIHRAGYSAFFFAAAVAAAACLLTSLALRNLSSTPQAAVASGLASLIPSARILPPILLALVFGLASGAVFVFLPTYATQAGLSRIGGFYIAYSAAAIGIRLTCGRLSDRWGRQRVILPALLLMGSGTLGLVWLVSPVGLLVVGTLTGMAHGLLFPALSAYTIDLADSEGRGRALGAFSTAMLLGHALASFTFGIIAERFGYRLIYLLASTIVMTTFMVLCRTRSRAQMLR